MSFVSALAEKGDRVAAHRPWPRVVVDADVWRQAVLGIAAGEATMLGLWSDGEAVHMALIAEPATELLVVSLPCPERRFPSVGATHPPALRLERTIRDLYGLEPEVSPDTRRWLDHGRWGVRQPLGRARAGTGHRRRLHLQSRRRPAAAPDPRRPRACGDHRARPLPLHRQRRDGGAPGGAAGLRAQGHRRADARRPAGKGGAARRSHFRRQHGGRLARLRPRGRGRASASSRRRAPSSCAR